MSIPGGYPILGLGGVPHLRSGRVPHLRSRRVPHLRSGGTPSQFWGGPPSQVRGRGVPQVVPPPQNSKHLLRLCSGRYASCVHAGGLSCVFYVFTTRGVSSAQQYNNSGGFRGAHPARGPPPTDQNFFNFIGFFRKYY